VNKTINGKAAVCHWGLILTFLDKEQAVSVVNGLLREEIDFPVSYRTDMTDSRTIHIVEIEDMPWAANLSTVARIAKSIDYDMNVDDEAA
jgi:hypothetical protein